MDKNRLLWASRRGMLELDLMLLPFSQLAYPTLDVCYQQAFEHLLEQEDQDIFQWLLGLQCPLAEDQKQIVEMVRQFARRKTE